MLNDSENIRCFHSLGLLCSFHIFGQWIPIQSGHAHRLKIQPMLSVYGRKMYLCQKKGSCFSFPLCSCISSQPLFSILFTPTWPPPRIRGKCDVINSDDLLPVSGISISILRILRHNSMFFVWMYVCKNSMFLEASLCYLQSPRIFSLIYLYLYFKDSSIMLLYFSSLVATSECLPGYYYIFFYF